MNLGQVLDGINILKKKIGKESDVAGICYAANHCVRGSLFVAISGLAHDGHDFIGQAVERGACFVVHQRDMELPEGITSIQVSDSRRALGRIAQNFFGNPSARLTLIGITGTSGKTTITYLLESILTAAGYRCGVLGTVNYRYDGKILPAPNTTPESCEMQKILCEMANAGMTHVLAEVSSHALNLKRVDDCDFDLGIFTNLSPEHLDYHHDMEDYFRAKKRLFTEILPQSKKNRLCRAVVNLDDPWGKRLLGEINIPSLAFGRQHSSEAGVAHERITLNGIHAQLDISGNRINVNSGLIGSFNLSNILAACAACSVLGVPPAAMEAGIAKLTSVPGRLEKIDFPGGIHVFVDYAHKPDALKQALQNLDRLKERRIVTVFGCGGDRDRSKRPLMGEVATHYSHFSIITSDNPRSEDPLAIICEIEAGIDQQTTRKEPPDHLQFPDSGHRYAVIADRKTAINAAIHLAEPGDIVFIAGKGHENYQILGNTKVMFDDRIVAMQALQSRFPQGSEAESPVFSFAEVLAATGGRLLAGHQERKVFGVSTDTRHIRQGNLFIALSGQNFDGHDFVQKAAEAGAACVLISNSAKIDLENMARHCAVMEVADTLLALGDLAHAHRMRFSCPVIAMTGSSGKTTTKEMLACILGREKKVLKTEGNFNNLVGLPQTIFRMNGYDDVAVLEMGTNARGEIGRLTRIASPDIGLITNIGPAHLAGFGSVDGVREEKGDLFLQMNSSGIAVVNLDDDAVCKAADGWSGRRVTFSMSASADVGVCDIRKNGVRGTSFNLLLRGRTHKVDLKVAGIANVYNAMAAAAVAMAAGVSSLSIQQGLMIFEAVPGRMEMMKLQNGAYLINDAYNANPASMREALLTLKDLKGLHHAYVFLGDMLELGEVSTEMHRRIGILLATIGVTAVYLKGEFAEMTASGALDGGMKKEQIVFLKDTEDVVHKLKKQLKKGDWILVKGSHSMRLDKMVNHIQEVIGVVRTEGKLAAV